MQRNTLYVLAASFLLASAASARTRTGTLAGTVIGLDGKPAADAMVMAQGSDGKTPLGTHTNAQGRFYFPLLRSGFYDVRASRGRTASEWKHNIMVHVGRQTNVILHLGRLKPPKKVPASISKNSASGNS
jgi:hypothetical protein